MSRPVIVIGCGGHSRVVASCLRAIDKTIVAFTSLDPRRECAGVDADVCSDEEACAKYSPEDVELVMGIGPVVMHAGGNAIGEVVKRYRALGYRFIGFQHPSAWVAAESKVAATAQIHAGATIQPGASIGEFSIINTHASVDHDCSIGNYCHVAPGATLCGSVTVGDGTYIGAGSTIIQGVRIGDKSFVAAGACVVRDLAEKCSVRGVPARLYSPKTQLEGDRCGS